MPKAPRDEKRPVSWKIWEPKAPKDAKRPVLIKILGAEGAKEREASHLRRKVGRRMRQGTRSIPFGVKL